MARHHDLDVEDNVGVFTCQRVLDGAPVLLVAHEPDGDWQFLCGGDHSEAAVDGPAIVHVAHLVERDKSLKALLSLPCNYEAERDGPSEPWRRIDRHEQFIVDAIDGHGWAITIIPADDEPGFAYTTGLYTTLLAPELIIFGLPSERMHSILNEVGARARAGERLVSGLRLGGVIDRFDVELRAITDHKPLAYSRWYHQGSVFPVLQVVYPDSRGRFPGEPKVNPALAKQQPLLR